LVNPFKTRLIHEGSQKIVTGVSISGGRPKLPRASVREIKRDAHFLLRNGLFKHSLARKTWDPLITERLIGRVNFWLQVDPENQVAERLLAGLKSFPGSS
jgi:RNA-directed DNA polymerase